jgi:hypothetical protein
MYLPTEVELRTLVPMICEQIDLLCVVIQELSFSNAAFPPFQEPFFYPNTLASKHPSNPLEHATSDAPALS